MSQMHDSLIIGYEVDGMARRLVLHTEWRGGGSAIPANSVVERSDAIFEGLEAYVLRNDVLADDRNGNIIYSIKPLPLEPEVQRRWSEFEASSRQSAWPSFWQDNEAKMRERIAQLARDGVKWFELSSSYGMDGWIIARSMTLLDADSDSER
jgi:hypothetical protein